MPGCKEGSVNTCWDPGENHIRAFEMFPEDKAPVQTKRWKEQQESGSDQSDGSLN